ncbi:hypothetical protein FGG78_40840 [Thioclava sp. BHET1]|nr:hypothetical protein FGG78_40840 [Thioclava sp. BHET1]
MQLLTSIFKELLGLFVDDGNLALQLVVLIALVAAAVRLGGLAPLAGGGLLLAGCIVILALSLRRMMRR